MSAAKKKQVRHTLPRQFRLDDAAVNELDDLVDWLGLGTRTAIIRLLIRERHVRELRERVKKGKSA